jgi:hypothetical protein
MIRRKCLEITGAAIADKGRRELTIPESEALALIKRDVDFVNKLWLEA